MMTLSPLLVTLLAATHGDERVSISARLDAPELAVGGTYELVIELSFAGTESAKRAGMPAPMLQINVPEAVELTGKRLNGYKELAAHEFLQEPFERLIEDGSARVAFTLKEEPTADDTIGLIVTGYVDGGAEGPWFLRRRLELPVAGGAVARQGDDADSSWGPDDSLIQIGQQAPVFTLPKPDGGLVSLDQYLGERNIIVTTFRAHW